VCKLINLLTYWLTHILTLIIKSSHTKVTSLTMGLITKRFQLHKLYSVKWDDNYEWRYEINVEGSGHRSTLGFYLNTCTGLRKITSSQTLLNGSRLYMLRINCKPSFTWRWNRIRSIFSETAYRAKKYASKIEYSSH
jgi:hypothetical protein